MGAVKSAAAIRQSASGKNRFAFILFFPSFICSVYEAMTWKGPPKTVQVSQCDCARVMSFSLVQTVTTTMARCFLTLNDNKPREERANYQNFHLLCRVWVCFSFLGWPLFPLLHCSAACSTNWLTFTWHTQN